MTKSCPLYNFKTVKICSYNFIQVLSTIRRCAMHSNHNSKICIFFSYSPLNFVRSSSVTKSCLCLTWKPLKMSSWNFIQILGIIRQRADHKDHDSCLYSFEVIPFQTLANSSYIFLTPLEMQVQHFMLFTHLCTLLTFWVFTPLLYQNLTFCLKLHHSNTGETSVFT